MEVRRGHVRHLGSTPNGVQDVGCEGVREPHGSIISAFSTMPKNVGVLQKVGEGPHLHKEILASVSRLINSFNLSPTKTQ